jgi:uncharacterized membrane protein
LSSKAAITVLGARDEVERRWQASEYAQSGATLTFAEAPGDRGTEIVAEPGEDRGKLGEIAGKLTGSDPLAQLKDDLRRFKQEVETGVIARSEAVPEGETVKRKLKRRPAQPLDDSELEKAGV